ncbi:hypothetical protein N9P82_00595 [bacterium]|nr:hypothetical protein [bacterium]
MACSELLPILEDLCIDKFGAVRKAVPSENPRLADRWNINKSAQYTKGIPKALGRASHICTSCGYAHYLKLKLLVLFLIIRDTFSAFLIYVTETDTFIKRANYSRLNLKTLCVRPVLHPSRSLKH